MDAAIYSRKMTNVKRVKGLEVKESEKNHRKLTQRVFINNLPDEILQEIFIAIPGNDLASSCVCVCQRWNKIIQCQKLWKRKCTLDHHYTNEMMKWMMSDDFRTLYFKNPYNRNLILNPEALEGLKHWFVKADGEFRVETKQVGLHRHPQLSKYAGGTIQCWIPTYRNHSKVQMVDLLANGCTTEMLDIVRPNIIITDWFTGHYTLNVQLLKTIHDNDPLFCYGISIKKPFAGRLHCARLRVTDYDPGLRYIRFQHGGRQLTKLDHYDDHCTKMTLSSVRFDIAHTFGRKESIEHTQSSIHLE